MCLNHEPEFDLFLVSALDSSHLYMPGELNSGLNLSTQRLKIVHIFGSGYKKSSITERAAAKYE